MNQSPKISAEALGVYLQEHAPALAEKIIAAINAAPDGDWIGGSEELVRDAGHEFTRLAFEAALQQKVDAAQSKLPRTVDSSGKKNETRECSQQHS